MKQTIKDRRGQTGNADSVTGGPLRREECDVGRVQAVADSTIENSHQAKHDPNGRQKLHEVLMVIKLLGTWRRRERCLYGVLSPWQRLFCRIVRRGLLGYSVCATSTGIVPRALGQRETPEPKTSRHLYLPPLQVLPACPLVFVGEKATDAPSFGAAPCGRASLHVSWGAPMMRGT